MDKSKYTTGGYILAVALGAIAGGIAVAVITRAIPVMTSKMMGNMMENMMTRMNPEGCDPEEMWGRMKRGFGEARKDSA